MSLITQPDLARRTERDKETAQSAFNHSDVFPTDRDSGRLVQQGLESLLARNMEEGLMVDEQEEPENYPACRHSMTLLKVSARAHAEPARPQ
jgi:hypothetical protein